MSRNRNGQSIIEYVILLAVIIAALLIMQVFIKRGFQGGLKEASDRMGEQFSAGNTTIRQSRTMTGNQNIHDEVATGATSQGLVGSTGLTVTGVKALGAYQATTRTGGTQAAEVRQSTDAASREATRWADYSTTQQGAFTDPF